MGVLGIVRGLIKTVEGIAEGDGEKIMKGLVKTGTGVVTTVTGSTDDDNDNDDD